MDNKIKIIVVVGPTASGKTSLSISLAERFNGEIVSADSMQLYKLMDIGTAKPTADEMKGIPHHLIDCVELDGVCSVADYCEMANRAIDDIVSRNKLPILVGGTGLYVNSLINGISFDGNEKNDDKLREELNVIYQTQGRKALYELLKELDPQEAAVIDRYNHVRLIRAIEVCKLYNTTMTEYKKRNLKGESRFLPLKIGLSYSERSALYKKIDCRVDLMLENGLLDEARAVLAASSRTAMQAIGYKELSEFFNGNEGLEAAVDKIKRQSRHYAKRQLTWFNRDSEINWFFWDEDEQKNNKIKKNIDDLVENFLNV